MWKVVSVLVAGVLALVAFAPVSSAQGFREAEIEFNRGELMLEMRDYPRAIFALKKAYSIIPDKRYLASLARAYDQKGDAENALLSAERYLQISGDSAAADIKDMSLRLKEQLVPTCGRVTIVLPQPGGKLTVTAADGNQQVSVAPETRVDRWLPLGKASVLYEVEGYSPSRTDIDVVKDKTTEASVALVELGGQSEIIVDANVDNAQVSIDGKAVGAAPIKTKVDAGDHVIQVWAPNHLAWVGVVDAPALKTVSVDAKLVQTKKPSPTVPVTAMVVDESGGWSLSTWGWITLGTGVAALGTAGYFYYSMLTTFNDANAMDDGPDKDAKMADVNSLWVISMACGVAGGVASGGGLLMVLLDDSGSDAEVAPFELLTLSPAVLGDSFVLDAAWSF
jgi:hypothetical protein